jgi:fucose 4-O-acetylase-like acetyltransferase
MNRELGVDTLRGLACILLVSFHVVGMSPNTGLHLPEVHELHRVNAVLSYLRMPLFSFLSGYVYAYRPFQRGAMPFIQGKGRRLLLPMLTLGTLFAIVQSLTPVANGSLDQWWLMHIVPVGHYWFLEALFIIFLIVLALEQLQALSGRLVFLTVWVISVLMHVWVKAPVYFALDGVVYLLPFFLAGLACKRFDIDSGPSRVVAALTLATSALWLWSLWGFGAPHTSPGQDTLLPGLLAGASSAFLLLRSGWRAQWLAYVGGYSFAIYLLHVFFTAGSRIALSWFDITNTWALMVSGTTFGIVGPIAAALLIRQSERSNLWLLGVQRR